MEIERFKMKIVILNCQDLVINCVCQERKYFNVNY